MLFNFTDDSDDYGTATIGPDNSKSNDNWYWKFNSDGTISPKLRTTWSIDVFNDSHQAPSKIQTDEEVLVTKTNTTANRRLWSFVDQWA